MDMLVRDGPKLLCKAEMKPDLISNLPDTIIEQILSHLPIRDAARTSILSTAWRYRWATLPYLVFDHSSFPLETNGEQVIKTNPVWIIDQILMLHIGPIQKFKLYHGYVEADVAIDRWILHLSRSSIKDIMLAFTNVEAEYKVPRCLFSCESLTSLSLVNCLVKPPSMFKGFKYLKRIEFIILSMAQDVLENLITGCPVLEWLTLLEVDLVQSLNVCSTDLKIKAPNLQFFHGAIHHNVSFENTPSLAEVTICCDDRISDKNQANRNSGNLIKFLNPLPRLQRLTIDFVFLEHLSFGIELSNLPRPCFGLDYLFIPIDLNNEELSSAALAILSIAPNLRKLIVRSIDVGTPINFWEECSNCLLNKLQTVEVFIVYGEKPELDFLKFLLSNSPALEKLVCYIHDDRYDTKPIEKRVLNLSRFSDTAEILCFGYYSSCPYIY